MKIGFSGYCLIIYIKLERSILEKDKEKNLARFLPQNWIFGLRV